MLRRVIRFILRPIHRFLIVRTTVEDPWDLAPSFTLSFGRLGAGSVRPLSWYFEGSTEVAVLSLEDVKQWLAGCQYVRDPDLFHESDYWQHPKTFEQLRRGDCEDHALWAWRRLLELGIKADFYVGQWVQHPDNSGHHAWLVVEIDAQQFLFETVDKDVSRQLRPLQEVRAEYVPHYSVGADHKVQARAGLLLYWRQLELERRKCTTDRPPKAA